MKKTVSKSSTREQIEKFFSDVKNKNPKEIKKIKRLAMAHNIPLKGKRKLFCKKCLAPYSGTEKTKIKNKTKTIICKNCQNINRWKL